MLIMKLPYCLPSDASIDSYSRTSVCSELLSVFLLTLRGQLVTSYDVQEILTPLCLVHTECQWVGVVPSSPQCYAAAAETALASSSWTNGRWPLPSSSCGLRAPPRENYWLCMNLWVLFLRLSLLRRQSGIPQSLPCLADNFVHETKASNGIDY